MQLHVQCSSFICVFAAFAVLLVLLAHTHPQWHFAAMAIPPHPYTVLDQIDQGVNCYICNNYTGYKWSLLWQHLRSKHGAVASSMQGFAYSHCYLIHCMFHVATIVVAPQCIIYILVAVALCITQCILPMCLHIACLACCLHCMLCSMCFAVVCLAIVAFRMVCVCLLGL